MEPLNHGIHTDLSSGTLSTFGKTPLQIMVINEAIERLEEELGSLRKHQAIHTVFQVLYFGAMRLTIPGQHGNPMSETMVDCEAEKAWHDDRRADPKSPREQQIVMLMEYHIRKVSGERTQSFFFSSFPKNDDVYVATSFCTPSCIFNQKVNTFCRYKSTEVSELDAARPYSELTKNDVEGLGCSCSSEFDLALHIDRVPHNDDPLRRDRRIAKGLLPPFGVSEIARSKPIPYFLFEYRRHGGHDPF